MYFVAKRKLTGISLKAVALLGILALLVSLSFTTLVANAAAGITVSNTTLRLSEVPVVSGTGYTPNERIDLWLTSPSSTVKAYGYVYADSSGSFTDFSYVPSPDLGLTYAQQAALSTDAEGTWYVTARGNVSNFSSYTSFSVVGVTLTASLANVIGDQTTITYSGQNYFSNEVVSLWVTDSTGKVLSLGNTYATSTGTLPSLEDSNAALITTLTFANDGLTGPLWITAHGNTDGQTVYTQIAGS